MAMHQEPARGNLSPAQHVAERVFNAVERFLHVEAVSGVVLLVAAATALIWANSPAAASYHALWHGAVVFSIGHFTVSQSVHFIINDILMTVFFLVVGMEIKREMHDGALSDWRSAALPLAAAIGGVLVPAAIYLSFNIGTAAQNGWAIPTATDIAFAVGVLALLGKSIPASVRALLLALAIVDDVTAVLIIAAFYSSGLDLMGLPFAAAGIVLVLGLQRIGIGSAYAYVVPGALLWYGLLKLGVHPTLAGVVLGLMTPVVSINAREAPMQAATRALGEFTQRVRGNNSNPHELMAPVKQLAVANRELLPPAVRVQMTLHPWVAYGVMPLFALANAGVSFDGLNLQSPEIFGAALGIVVALVIGKPVGIVLSSWLAVRAGWCRLPEGTTWRGVVIVGCLGGIGFTMSIFIAMLAFPDEQLLIAAKMGIVVASALAAIMGLTLGAWRR